MRRIQLILPVIDDSFNAERNLASGCGSYLTLSWYHDLPEIESDLEENLDVEMVCIKQIVENISHRWALFNG